MLRTATIAIIIAAMLGSPAMAGWRWSDFPKSDPGPRGWGRSNPFSHRGVGFRQRWPRPRGGLVVVPVPIVPPPMPHATAMTAGPMFEPPSRFRYYCEQPRGYFPTIARCAGPWIETGTAAGDRTVTRQEQP